MNTNHWRGQQSSVQPIAVIGFLLVAGLGLGLAGWWYVRENAGGFFGLGGRQAAQARALDDAIDIIPHDWLLVRIKADRAEKFFARLPKVKGWMARLDEWEKKLPPDNLEPERNSLAEGIHSEYAVACSPRTAVKTLILLTQPFAGFPPGPAGNLDEMVRTLNAFEARLNVLKSPPEFMNLQVRTGSFQLKQKLTSAAEVERVGEITILRFDADFLTEYRPGVLLGSQNLNVLTRVLRGKDGQKKRAPCPVDLDVVFHVPPDFSHDDVWRLLEVDNLMRKDGQLVLGNIWIGARVLDTGLLFVCHAEIEHAGLLEQARNALAKPAGKGAPHVRRTDFRVEGKTLKAEIEVDDAFIDQMLPTAEQIDGWMGLIELFSRKRSAK